MIYHFKSSSHLGVDCHSTPWWPSLTIVAHCGQSPRASHFHLTTTSAPTIRRADEYDRRILIQLTSTGAGLSADMAIANINFITFNQDHSCIAVGTSKGFRIYHTDPFSRVFTTEESNVSLIEMLFSTSLVALVISPRHLVIQNTKVCFCR